MNALARTFVAAFVAFVASMQYGRGKRAYLAA
jgi:hypothetical protein